MKPKTCLIFLSVFTFFQMSCSKQEKITPNIILILADDLGYGDLGCYGSQDISTPNIDKLSQEGVRFTQFYANGPECTPTRAALLTGRYQQRAGGLECAIGAGNVGRYDEAIWLKSKNELGLPVEYSTLPSGLKEAGYNTAIIGKWHLGYEKKFRPNLYGFDYAFGPIGYGGDYFYHVENSVIDIEDFTGAHNLAMNGKEIFKDKQYMTNLITEEATSWLERQNKENPFFLYIPYTAPHDPYQGPDDDIGRPLQGNEWKMKSRDKYIKMVEAMDKGIGSILNTLKNKGLDEQTIVIFFSDNGGTRTADNGILRGHKGEVYEGGIRVPCIIRYPANINENTESDQASISLDLTYSILSAAKADITHKNLDGYDIIKHVSKKMENLDRSLFWRRKRGNLVSKAIRNGDYKYLVVFKNDSIIDEKLFNLKNDLTESKDLLEKEPDILNNLRNELEVWEEDVESPRLEGFYLHENKQ